MALEGTAARAFPTASAEGLALWAARHCLEFICVTGGRYFLLAVSVSYVRLQLLGFLRGSHEISFDCCVASARHVCASAFRRAAEAVDPHLRTSVPPASASGWRTPLPFHAPCFTPRTSNQRGKAASRHPTATRATKRTLSLTGVVYHRRSECLQWVERCR